MSDKTEGVYRLNLSGGWLMSQHGGMEDSSEGSRRDARIAFVSARCYPVALRPSECRLTVYTLVIFSKT